jgi:hypothetical protein
VPLMYSGVVKLLIVVLTAVLAVSTIVILMVTIATFLEFGWSSVLLIATCICLLLQAVDSLALIIAVRK